jgi:hypothetical protein
LGGLPEKCKGSVTTAGRLSLAGGELGLPLTTLLIVESRGDVGDLEGKKPLNNDLGPANLCRRQRQEAGLLSSI